MKITCRKCSKEKDVSNFNVRKNRKKLSYSWCKECHREYNVNRYEKQKHQYVIYYLPEEHYCGVTDNLEARLRNHDRKGRNTNGWRVMFSHPDLNTVLHTEAMYHSVLGINGLNKTSHANKI